MRPFITTLTLSMAVLAALLIGRAAADACAGLIGSNGAVNLGRTTTLAAYHDGTEHYVTSFEFAGGGGEFGTLIPLPDVPTNVERGGAWTLQRLQQETAPPAAALAGASFAARESDGAEVLQEVRIDALDITVLKGGGADVAAWASDHGFRLSPDAPEVLDFYAQRSPIFLAAVFDGEAAAARGQALGDGTPVHLTIPTDNPWVPLRILALGKQADDLVQADVFLLTDDKPSLLPGERPELFLSHSDEATDLLLDDLRSDDGMGWVPNSAWLTKLQIDGAARDITYDLAVDASGRGQPSPLEAGFPLTVQGLEGGDSTSAPWLVLAGLAGVAAICTAAFIRMNARRTVLVRRALVVAALLTLLLSGGMTAAGCGDDEDAVTVSIRYSQFEQEALTVPAGSLVTFTLRNDDPIEHEWIVGTDEVHERHRTGTEPFHDAVANEVTIPALSTRETSVMFREPGTYSYICHLPGHEAYGMAGTLTVVES